MSIRTHLRKGRAGYTLTEVMVAMALVVIGFIGLLNLQVKTISAATDSLNSTQAMAVAEHYLASLQVEALSWSFVPDESAMPRLAANGFMSAPVAGVASDWTLAYPEKNKDFRVGLIGDGVTLNTWALDGGALTEIPTDVQRKFCVHYRLTWVQPGESIRAEVRVSWSRDEEDFSEYVTCPPEMVGDRAAVSQFTLPGTLMRNRMMGAM